MVADMPNKSVDNECQSNAAVGMSTDPDELMALGKRHMLLEEYGLAMEYFATACQQLASKHGDMGKECANAYYQYGRCLLEMARQNLSIVEPESAKAKGGEADEKKDDAGCSKMENIPEETESNVNKTEETNDEVELANGNTNDEENEETNGNEENEGAEGNEEEGEGEDNDENEENEENEEEEEDDDADSYLKLSWTFLDLAKVIYLKEKNVEGDFAAADCLMTLGEVSMEGGNFEAGAKDMREAIHLRRLHSGRMDRIVASSEFELGAALAQFQQYDDSLTALKECLSILSELNEKENEKLKETAEKEVEENLHASIKEFNELINDVKEKITEVEEEKLMRDVVKNELTEKAKEAVKAAAGLESSENASGEVKTLTARRKPSAEAVSASPARLNSALVSSLKSSIDSPATKSRVAALISMQLKRHRLDSPGSATGNGESVPVKRPASACSNENEDGKGESEEEVTSKRIRAETTTESAAN